MFEQAAGELRAKLMGSGGAWPDNESTRRAHISDPAPPVWRAPEGPEGTGGLRDRPLRAKLACGDLAGGRARRRPEHQRCHTATTRSMGGSQRRRLAGGPPPTGTPSDLAHRSGRHNKTARPHWGRAAVAVALGFEPRVAVTPHSISSAAPSAARTRYLTRILYYTLPPRAQIDRACWEQGHTAVQKPGHTTTDNQSHTAARSHGSTRNGHDLNIQNG